MAVAGLYSLKYGKIQHTTATRHGHSRRNTTRLDEGI